MANGSMMIYIIYILVREWLFDRFYNLGTFEFLRITETYVLAGSGLDL